MKKIIALFSSDEAPLYKSDVYRSLALPKNYVLHFRYNKRHIDRNFLDNLEILKKRNCVVFFASGNDRSILADDRNIKTFSIRKVKIKDIVKSYDTKWIHFYLQLGDFIDFKITKHDKRLIPPRQFVSEVSVSMGDEGKWIDRVKAIKNEFDDLIFFNIKSIKSKLWKKSCKQSPSYLTFSKESRFQLVDEEEYNVEFCFADFNEKGKAFNAEGNSKELSINIPTDFRIGAIVDNRNFFINTHSIEVRRVSRALRFYPDNKRNYEVILNFDIRRKKTKIFWFGVLSAISFFSFFLSQLSIELYKKVVIDFGDMVVLCLIGIILIGVSASFLYNLFNKK